jgi:hypothetical protein
VADENERDRIGTASKRPLAPDSLVGSFFHSDSERGWQGCIVAEPAPGVYLVETYEWIAGTSHNQLLVRIEEMNDWRFYDSAEWMNNAYEHGVERRWDRELKEREEASGD